MGERRSLPLFGISPAMVDVARERLTRGACPRRYCWYWHSLGFDWDMPPDQGCEVAERHVHRVFWVGPAVPPWQECCRATGNPLHSDYYEPREPHLEADGWPADFFQVVGKAARTRRFERRQRGERRRGGG